MNSQEEIIIQRLQKIKSWADIKKFSYEQQEGKGKVFSIFRKNRGRLITFYKESIDKGKIYTYIADGTFPGDLAQRDLFVEELIKNNFIDDDWKRKNHKHFCKDKKLQNLTNDELEKLLAILGKYCS